MDQSELLPDVLFYNFLKKQPTHPLGSASKMQDQF
jgi:hypothetical protein